MKTTKILSAAAATLAVVSAISFAHEPQGGTGSATPPAASSTPAPSAVDAAVVRAQKPSYPLTSCVVCGKPLAAKPVEHVREGKLYRLDAEACAKAVDADAAAFSKKIDEAAIAQQKPTYPLKTSPVSDKALDDKAVDYVYGTRLVRLASQDEVAAFQKDPAAAMAKVDKALIAAQLPSYTAKTCPVSGEPFGGEMGDPVDVLYGTKLVRLCCKSCVRTFEKDPEKYLSAPKTK